jgi:P-type Ca2+ transporter type 2C
MWKMIFGQAIVQLSILITMNFAGPQLTGWTGPTLRTVIFNTFMWLQFFNEINCRRLDNRFNVFEGIHKNLFFIVIMVTITVGQILIINFGGAAFSTTPLNVQQWLVSVGLGLISLPSGALIRLIPDSYISVCLPRQRRIMLPQDEDQPHDHPHDHPHYHHAPHNLQEAFSGIRDNLRFFKTLRSERRINQRQYRHRHISVSSQGTASDSDSLPSPPHLRHRSLSMFKTQTVVPAIIASSITFPVIPEGHAEAHHTGG